MKKIICGACGEEFDPKVAIEYFTNIEPVEGYCTDKCYFKAKRKEKKAVPLSDGVMLRANRNEMISLLKKHLEIEVEPLPRGNENINIVGFEKAIDEIIASMKLTQEA